MELHEKDLVLSDSLGGEVLMVRAIASPSESSIVAITGHIDRVVAQA